MAEVAWLAGLGALPEVRDAGSLALAPVPKGLLGGGMGPWGLLSRCALLLGERTLLLLRMTEPGESDTCWVGVSAGGDAISDGRACGEWAVTALVWQALKQLQSGGDTRCGVHVEEGGMDGQSERMWCSIVAREKDERVRGRTR